MTKKAFNPKAPPSWLNLPARIKWNYEFEQYAIQWFKSLSAEKLQEIFEVFENELRKIPVAHKVRVSSAQWNKGQVIDRHRGLMKTVINNHYYATDSDSRKLYDLLNYEFFAMKNRFAKGSMLECNGYNAWAEKVKKQVAPKNLPTKTHVLSDFVVLEEPAAKETSSTAYDFRADLKDSRLPETLIQRIVLLEGEVRTAQALNLDPQSQHSLDNIFGDWVPNMVKAYANAFQVKDRKGLMKVDQSVAKQLTTLEKFVSGLSSTVIHNSISEMDVQERFLRDKFHSSSIEISD